MHYQCAIEGHKRSNTIFNCPLSLFIQPLAFHIGRNESWVFWTTAGILREVPAEMMLTFDVKVRARCCWHKSI